MVDPPEREAGEVWRRSLNLRKPSFELTQTPSDLRMFDLRMFECKYGTGLPKRSGLSMLLSLRQKLTYVRLYSRTYATVGALREGCNRKPSGRPAHAGDSRMPASASRLPTWGIVSEKRNRSAGVEVHASPHMAGEIDGIFDVFDKCRKTQFLYFQ